MVRSGSCLQVAGPGHRCCTDSVRYNTRARSLSSAVLSITTDEFSVKAARRGRYARTHRKNTRFGELLAAVATAMQATKATGRILLGTIIPLLEVECENTRAIRCPTRPARARPRARSLALARPGRNCGE